MSVKKFNESFKMLYGNIKHNSKPLQESFQSELRIALNDKATELQDQGITNIKSYEMAFQEVLEKLEPNKSWWEVTDCNIFYDLFENRNIQQTVDNIINELKTEYKDKSSDDETNNMEEPITDVNSENNNITTESLNEDIETVLDTLLHNYGKLYDTTIEFQDDINDFIEHETQYSADCMKLFKIDVREMFNKGMQHCNENDSYTYDFDDFVRGAVMDIVYENESQFAAIHDNIYND